MTHTENHSKGRRLLLLVGGFREIYQKALSLDIDLIVLNSGEKLAELPNDKRSRAVEVDMRDAAACLAHARAIHQETPISAVVSFNEFALESAALIGEVLSIPSNPRGPVSLTRDKLAMRQHLANFGMGTVRYIHCDSKEVASVFLREVGGPIILKPYRGAGSKGISYVEQQNQIDSAWEWTTAGAGEMVIGEEFLPGPEYSVETMTLDGKHHVLTVTEKLTTGAPHFIEIGHQMPARLPVEVEIRIADEISTFLNIIGQRVGPAHTEFKLTDQGIRLIESQTRAGGDQIWEMTELTTGWDMYRDTMEHLLFGRRSLREKRVNAAAIRYFTAENATFSGIEGRSEAEAIPGIVRVHINARPGARLGPLLSSDSRVGYVLATGDDVEVAMARALDALEHVRIVTDQSDMSELKD